MTTDNTPRARLTARGFFYTAGGTLRAPWRLAIFALITVVAALLLIGISTSIAGPPVEPPMARGNVQLTGWFLWQPWLIVAALLAGHAVSLRFVERRSWRIVGLHREAARTPTLMRALALGAVTIGLPSLVLLGVGWLRAEDAAGSWWSSVAVLTLFLLPAALAEELMLRGYVFAVLRELWGVKWTLAVTSVVFGLLHGLNPGATVQSIAVVTLAGLFLGAVLLESNSLYAAWMAHFAWNWVLAIGLRAAVSGQPFPRPDYQVVDSGPDWATGGAWGPEGGAAAAAGMLCGLWYLFARRARAELPA